MRHVFDLFLRDSIFLYSEIRNEKKEIRGMRIFSIFSFWIEVKFCTYYVNDLLLTQLKEKKREIDCPSIIKKKCGGNLFDFAIVALPSQNPQHWTKYIFENIMKFWLMINIFFILSDYFSWRYLGIEHVSKFYIYQSMFICMMTILYIYLHYTLMTFTRTTQKFCMSFTPPLFPLPEKWETIFFNLRLYTQSRMKTEILTKIKIVTVQWTLHFNNWKYRFLFAGQKLKEMTRKKENKILLRIFCNLGNICSF